MEGLSVQRNLRALKERGLEMMLRCRIEVSERINLAIRTLNGRHSEILMKLVSAFL